MKRATRVRTRFYIKKDISIHALVKRATDRHGDFSFDKDISIHALVKRATEVGSVRLIIYGFQSTPS